MPCFGSASSFAPVVTSPTTTTTPAKGATTTTTAGGAAPKGVKLGAASDVPVGGAASFTDPKQGIPAYAVQPTTGQFDAFSAVCTHAGCTVQWDQQGKEFVCPCHESVYNGFTGAVINGPAVLPLPRIPIAEVDGELYVDG